MNRENNLFEVKDLHLYFQTRRGPVQAVDDVSFSLVPGRTIVIVGESGCGKTSLARAILRLLPRNVHTYKGSVYLNSTDIMTLGNEEFRKQIRWVKAAMVPQAAMNALNPVIKVEEQVAEPLLIHDLVADKDEAMERVIEACGLVGLPIDFLQRYPFELSGGMRQRAAIAMTLAARPELVVLDEPTSALDLLTQANIMNVLKRIKQETGITFILITHDIGTSSELADDAAVMYAGQIVEKSDAAHFFTEPLHPYAEKLMASVPTLREDKELDFIPGQPPSLLEPPTGCRFADRCHKRFEKCQYDPPLLEVKENHWVKCWLYE
ncbi:MAG TPA: ABC transporter ATP-binding protein [Firmicutes bacterium]|nr:ABC transporter ATP-binding protein [Bacillota bacterium]